MVACTHEEFPQPPNDEHPVVAIIAVIAMVLTMLLIMWARVEVHGTEDIEEALTGEDTAAAQAHKSERDLELEAAVAANRFATGLSP